MFYFLGSMRWWTGDLFLGVHAIVDGCSISWDPCDGGRVFYFLGSMRWWTGVLFLEVHTMVDGCSISWGP